MSDKEVALIVGAGSGLSASLARLFAKNNMQVALASRNIEKLEDVCRETNSKSYICDAVVPEQVDALYDSVVTEIGLPNIVVYNASARARGPISEVDREEFKNAIMVSCYAGFLVGQKAAQIMLPRGVVQYFLQVHRRVLRVTLILQLLLWVNLAFAGLLNQWLVNLLQKIYI